MEYDSIQKEVIKFLQGDIPLVSNPYAGLANSLNLTEEEVLGCIRQLQENGSVRRLGTILRHQRAGYTINAMVAWKVPEAETDRVGKIFSGYAAVSHCYLRSVPEDFGYNLFTMIHARSQEELDQLLVQLISASGLKDYQTINSIKELKKISMSYF
jgi:DNA-binding Lrp family transcriptional regulator